MFTFAIVMFFVIFIFAFITVVAGGLEDNSLKQQGLSHDRTGVGSKTERRFSIRELCSCFQFSDAKGEMCALWNTDPDQRSVSKLRRESGGWIPLTLVPWFPWQTLSRPSD